MTARGARWPHLARLAWRESRTARRRLLLYTSSISLGVAALVAIDSFARNVSRSVREQSRTLLGGDVALTSRRPFSAAADSIVDSLTRQGMQVARATTFPSMGVVPHTGLTRLVQVRGVSEGYPLYGVITTVPTGRWRDLQRGAHALVDPSLLVALQARVGDTLTLGYGRFRIIGTLADVPGTPGVAELLGPRVFIPARYVPETQLLVFGSTAEYAVLGKLAPGTEAKPFAPPVRARLRAANVSVRTAAESEANTTQAIDQLSNFIGIVGLVALLLGGIGVASGVRAFVARKIDTVAMLRCLGASSGQVLGIYVAQAAAVGIVGALAGAALGVALQFLLPGVTANLLPVDVTVTLEPRAILMGLLAGGWIALMFALRPLLAVRTISPLQTLRRAADADILRQRWTDWPRLTVDVLLAASVLAISLARSEEVAEGLWIGAAVGGALLVLAGSAKLLSLAARRLLRRGWPYVIRQGIANLYRPANQTMAVVLSLGFGAFLVTTLYVVRSNLLRQFSFASSVSSGNVVFFDVQEDQVDGVSRTIASDGHAVLQRVPVVPMRIASINGRAVSAGARSDSAGGTGRGRGSWATRREYRSTFRDTLVASERLIAGRWHAGSRGVAGDTGGVSLEEDIASELGVRVGDAITWDVQGVQVPTRVTSLRAVTWTRFEPNFFAVFTPEALSAAPKQFVLLTQVPTAAQVARLQQTMVMKYPNVSSVDLSMIQRTITGIMNRVATAVRFMALVSLVMAIPVLVSAVAATRRERVREGVLLKTLGASRAQITRILVSEYALLGLIGSLTGVLLAIVAGWAVTHFIFEGDFTPALAPAVAIAALFMGLTVCIGLLAGRDVFRETPASALRES